MKTIEEQEGINFPISKGTTVTLYEGHKITKKTLEKLHRGFEERDRIAREEAIKECEGCVPEAQDENPMEDGVPVETYGYEKVWNSCREQTLQAISKLRV